MEMIVNLTDKKNRKKKYSKNKKKYQRKHIELDVYGDQTAEDHDETTRKILKHFEDNFIIDCDGTDNTEIKTIEPKQKREKRPLEEGLKPTDKVPKKLKCHRFVDDGLPGMKAISKKGDTIKQTNKVLRKALENKRKEIEKGIHSNSSKNIKKPIRKKVNTHKNKKCFTDMWEKKTPELDKFQGTEQSYIEEGINYFKFETKEILLKAPKGYRQKKSAIQSLQVPNAGTSYNPTLKDHKALVMKASRMERKRSKKSKKTQERLKKVLPPSSVSEKEQMEEELEGLPMLEDRQGEDEEEEDEIEENNIEDTAGVTQSKIKRKKSISERKKIKTKKVKKLKIKKTTDRKQFEKTIKRVPEFEDEIKEEKKELEIRKLKILIKKESSKFRPKRISKYAFEEPIPIVPVTENEMPGSIRQIMPLGDNITDHFTNLIRRNMLDARGPKGKRQKKKSKGKYKVKKHLRTYKVDFVNSIKKGKLN